MSTTRTLKQEIEYAVDFYQSKAEFLRKRS